MPGFCYVNAGSWPTAACISHRVPIRLTSHRARHDLFPQKARRRCQDPPQTLEYVFEQAQIHSRRRASAVNRPRDLIEAVIEDAKEFFFSEHFMVAIDIVLSTSTDQAVRKQILDISRKARRPVEAAWAEALAADGVPASVAADIVALTLGVVRGMALRTLWDNDPKWFDQLFALWRQMIKSFLEAQQK